MRRSWIAVAALVGALALSACGDDSPGTAPDYGPAPTDPDLGPNDTSNAPITVQGVLRLDGPTCAGLESEAARYSLAFDSYGIGDDNGTPALIADNDDRVVARNGDTVVLSGYPASDPEAVDECGTFFDVESFNSVTATASG